MLNVGWASKTTRYPALVALLHPLAWQVARKVVVAVREIIRTSPVSPVDQTTVSVVLLHPSAFKVRLLPGQTAVWLLTMVGVAGGVTTWYVTVLLVGLSHSPRQIPQTDT